ncbi:MAG: hypothetical protein ACODAU_01775 [Myxococcota bacterium]
MGASERLRARTLRARFQRLTREREAQDAALAALRREAEAMGEAAVADATEPSAPDVACELRARFDALCDEPLPSWGTGGGAPDEGLRA